MTIPLLKTPAPTWRKSLATVSADPLLSVILQRLAQFKKDGVDNYGYVLHKFYWGPSVNSEDSAIVGDCMDTSHAGTIDVKSGTTLSVGLMMDDTRITFQRHGNTWLASNIQSLDPSC
ncbi:hypothetical protein ABIB25_003876 [Nakamurella sp. UYEF19]|uniref:hypothetical protein n=1 Tax=Nakamurella sp. UYEF19 TaxID=1756392 RepID=UPI0033972C5F